MNREIHPSAVVEESAVLGDNCRIGPFSYVGPHVTMGSGNVLHSHAVVDGHIELGDENEIFSFACLGKRSQDLKYRDEIIVTMIGNRNVFREYATVNMATLPESPTTIGSNCLLLSYSHVAHDCRLGDNVIISSDSKMAGHVTVGDHGLVLFPDGRTETK